jgi:hypothetical protein
MSYIVRKIKKLASFSKVGDLPYYSIKFHLTGNDIDTINE